MESSKPRLTPLQSELLDAFFDRTQEFFLSGGAALAAFHLHHRETKDLDLFGTAATDIERGARALNDAALALGATARVLQQSGDFRRFLVSRSDETTIVDMVIDRVPQIVAEKTVIGRVRVDPVREIAANKLCTLLDRSEVRDLADFRLLLAGGLRLEDVLRDAQLKHAGADPATLAWALSSMRPAPSAPPPAGMDLAEIEAFRADLVSRLLRLATPPEPQ